MLYVIIRIKLLHILSGGHRLQIRRRKCQYLQRGEHIFIRSVI